MEPIFDPKKIDEIKAYIESKQMHWSAHSL